jgi:hypothetical protein
MVLDLAHASGMALGSCLIVELGASLCYDRASEILILMHLAHEALHFDGALWRGRYILQSPRAVWVWVTPGVK